MNYGFDTPVVRRGTNCVKWDDDAQDDILPLWVADMDFEVAPAIREAIEKRAQHPVFGYTHVPDEYYTAIINWFSRRHQWHIERDWVLYTIGVVPAASVCIKALTEPGDKVLVQTPVYNCFFSSIRNQGCEIVESPLVYDKEQGFYSIDFADFEQKCADPKVKVFLLCNPHNPACRVWTADELQRLNDICLKHGARVVSDEIHCELTIPGVMYVPFGRVSEACQQNGITLCSPSKSFNIAGLQTANIVCSDAALRAKIDRVINIFEVCDLNPFGPVALMAAYNESEDWLDALRAYIYKNYLELSKFFREELPEWTVTRLEGTYLAWVDISSTGMTANELAAILKSRGRVRVCSGQIYGEEAGRDFIRINMATQHSRLMEGLQRIVQTVRTLKES